MATFPHKSRERAYRNILCTTISTLWLIELLNHANLHLPHTNCRKVSYIHLARDDLQRCDLFKPAQCIPSLTLPSSALPALFADMTSAPGPHTPHSNKLLFSLGPAPLNFSANTTKHGLTLPPPHAHNSSTHSNLTFSNTNPQPLPGPYRPSPPHLPPPL